MTKYVVVYDDYNDEYHLHRLCKDGNPSNRKELVCCESLHEIFELGKNFDIRKEDIVDFLKIGEVKQYSE